MVRTDFDLVKVIAGVFSSIEMLDFVATLFLAIAAPLSYLATFLLGWRYARFSQPYKLIFAVTVFPILVVGIIANIMLVASFFPSLWDAVVRVRGAPGKLDFLLILLSTAPVPFLLIWVWHRALSRMARRASRSAQ